MSNSAERDLKLLREKTLDQDEQIQVYQNVSYILANKLSHHHLCFRF